MDAFLFVITIPTAEHEKYLADFVLKSSSNSLLHSVSINMGCESNDDSPKQTRRNKLLDYGKTHDLSGISEKSNLTFESHEKTNDSMINLNNSGAEGLTFEAEGKMKKSETQMSLKSSMDGIYHENPSKVSTPTKETQSNVNTPVKDSKPKGADTILNLEDVVLEKVLKQTLSELNIPAISWTLSTEGKHYQISFGVQGGVYCERILHEIKSCGVGSRPDSTLSVLPCALYYSALVSERDKHIGRKREIKDSAWTTFVRSVRSRLTVAQLLEQVKAGAALTFDFFFLLIVAALTAAIGLAENSTVCLVASMLISPLMGPIMAGTFGTAIQDGNLQKIGVFHEFIGVFVTMGVGFVFGLVICGVDENYGTGDWPTSEIMSRCDVRSLWIGALVALPSGAAVAISILAGNTTSLVGVAISASLLPPAVNAGLMWALSLVHCIFLNDDTRFNNIVKTNDYSDNPVIELAIEGCISLFLTLINIVCIFVGGILVLMIKNVAPLNSTNETEWQRDIKAARDFNKKLSKEGQSSNQSHNSKTIESDRSDFENAIENAVAWEAFHVTQRDLIERLKQPNKGHMTWSPSVTITKRPTIQDLYGMYRRFSETADNIEPNLTKRNQCLRYSRLQESPSTSAKISGQLKSESMADPKSKFIITPVDDPNYKAKQSSSSK